MADSNESGPEASSSSSRDSLSLLDLPSSVILHMLTFLRHAEVYNFRRALPYPSILKICGEVKRKAVKDIQFRNDFRWIRSVGTSVADQMASRLGHSMAYHEKDNAMYIFGGKAVDVWGNNDYSVFSDLDEHACFNDLWKLDMATMRCFRVIVRSTPYPLPKFNSTMLVYKDELLLFGGHRPVPANQAFRPSPNTNEVHLFNTKTNTWKMLITLNDGPCLSGHCATLSGNCLIVYGGHLTPYEFNTTFWVLDLKSRRWFKPEIPNVPNSTHVSQDLNALLNMEFPAYECGTTSVISLKDGHILLLGELRQPVFTKNWGVLFSFDPKRIETEPWTWRKLPVEGKWWEQRVIAEEERSSVRPKNCVYPKVVALRTEKAIRLVTVGLSRIYNASNTMRLANMYDARQRRLRKFVDHATKLVSTEMRRRDADYRYCVDFDDQIRTTAEYSHDGIDCRIEGCYLTRDAINMCKRSRVNDKPRTTDSIHVTVSIDASHPSQLTADLDEADKHDIINSIKHAVHQLHVTHYTSQMQLRLSPVQSRFMQKPRLVSYSALIPMGPKWSPEQLEHIVYEPGSSHFRAPPQTVKFNLCAAKDEVMLHGGAVGNPQNGTMRMGYTYLMTPSDREREEAGSSGMNLFSGCS